MTDADQPAPPSPPADSAVAAGSPTEASAFAELGLEAPLLKTLGELGYEEPTPIQREAIPPLLAGRDLLAQAPTGTGKTAAFALPALQSLEVGRVPDGGASAIVLVPTRELAMQVAEALTRYGRDLGVRVLPIYGGQPIGQQLRGLRRGVDVIVATPGRAVDHLSRGSLRLDAVRIVVLDEADEMLDMGFAEDLEAILGAIPAERQTALFSATISTTVRRIADRHLKTPVRVTVHAEKNAGDGIARVRQVAYVVKRADKLAALCRLLDVEDPASALVFARTRGEVDDLAAALSSRGHDAGALHGGLSQEQRDRMMGRFRDGSLDVLVATDVAARGLDIDHVSHVVNFDVPSDPDAYVHRIGRTGRAGREGTAITLVEPREHRLLRNIETSTRTKLEIARLPTVADLRERQLDILRANLREALVADDFGRYRGVIEPLSEEFDLVDIALAAVALASAAEGHDRDEPELAAAWLPTGPEPRRAGGPIGPGRPAGAPRSGGYVDRGGPARGPASARPSPAGRPGRPATNERPAPGGRPLPARRDDDGAWVRLVVGGGRDAGMRPGDLVGAITNEAGVGGGAVGAIQIADQFSLVDVAAPIADDIIAALRGATIRGRHLSVDRDERSAQPVQSRRADHG
ncbi:MAG: ATP-dependent helicase DeaD [Solirubrobacterales bacterium]|nr:ATP-dependent helicase DeaD [Solirubrobacterales bacterium]